MVRGVCSDGRMLRRIQCLFLFKNTRHIFLTLEKQKNIKLIREYTFFLINSLMKKITGSYYKAFLSNIEVEFRLLQNVFKQENNTNTQFLHKRHSR